MAAFPHNTQPETAQALNLDSDDNTRRQFLNRLKNEIQKRGIIDVLRKGIEHGQHSIRLFYGTSSPGNEAAATLHAKNRFSVTRQVRYSTRNPGLSLDLVLFINGLPLITFELKNNLTKQTVEDAVEQYRTSRDPRDDLFRPGRCAAHMAVDENRVRFCTELAGLKSVFLPFDQGHDGGAGNPPNPQGLSTDYLWQETLMPEGLRRKGDIVTLSALSPVGQGLLFGPPLGVAAPAGLPVVLGAGLTTGLAQDSRSYAVPALAEFLGFPLT